MINRLQRTRWRAGSKLCLYASCILLRSAMSEVRERESGKPKGIITLPIPMLYLINLKFYLRGKPFIPQTHVCCSGVPSPRPLPASSVRCCGRNAYDSSRNSCCRGAVRPLGYVCDSCFGPCCHGKRHPDKICP